MCLHWKNNQIRKISQSRQKKRNYYNMMDHHIRFQNGALNFKNVHTANGRNYYKLKLNIEVILIVDFYKL